MTAPVQVLVVGFDQPRFSGEVLAELARLREAGIVALLDLLVVTRTDEGLEVVDLGEVAEQASALGATVGQAAAALLGGGDGGEGSRSAGGPTWSLDTLPVGTTAAVAFIEHRWAAPLADAISRAGGATLEETWLAPPDAARLAALLDREG